MTMATTIKEKVSKAFGCALRCKTISRGQATTGIGLTKKQAKEAGIALIIASECTSTTDFIAMTVHHNPLTDGTFHLTVLSPLKK